MGSGAWSEELMATQNTSGQNGLNGLFSRLTSSTQRQQRHFLGTSELPMGSDDASTPGAPRPGRVIKPSPTVQQKNDTNVPTSVLPMSGGQQLGGSSRTQSLDPRQA
eukprot:CAMPEP_0172404700 /NCGR_PEP_ID=MMETSP1061-20121228/64056_1 /TAXON_ID=37318 /ORGANISM="Pseudo-nitzschia pungens, Strain cf. pungens" /LENGTH=106 /DNA_ID=CAMNT_0013139605 /DNA_START=522 /DNA_END=838 /DNA_ORIENTATION=+